MNNFKKKSLDFHSKDAKVIAIIVTYNPSIQEISRVFPFLLSQVNQIIVVDNGSNNSNEISQNVCQIKNAQFLSLPKNYGIAHAQNVGIRAAHELGATHILTLDQDSVPSAGMVNILLNVYKEYEGSDIRVAAVGPILKDEDSNLPLPFFSFSEGKKKRIYPIEENKNLNVGFLVSSGSLISMSALIEIGLMQEQLFISYVDVEWGLRARSYGYQIYGSCNTHMIHNLGERRLKIGPWLIPMHSPIRHFYLMRSGVYMQKLKHIPYSFKRADVFQLIRSFIIFSFFGLPSFKEISSMINGIISGLKMKVTSAPRI